MKRLNIFVDETGDFGFENGSSQLYGVSFTFHDQNNDITPEINNLNDRLKRIGYTGMIHMANLIMKRDDYKNFTIKARKSIFNSIYNFTRKIPIKYQTIIVDKKYIDNCSILRKKLLLQINDMIRKIDNYLKKFDVIVMYYDNAQEILGKILDQIFSKYNGFEHRELFDHKEKRLFQVSDMLTFIDKYNYKYKNKMKFTKGEKYFFTDEEIRLILRNIDKKRI